MSYPYLVWANLKRRKLRTLLTVLSILVAFVLFGFLAAIRVAFNAGVDVAGADRLFVRHKVTLILPLPESYEQRIEAIEGVEAAAHGTWFGGIYQDKTGLFQTPVNPKEFLDIYPEYVLEPNELEAWLATRTGAIAGRKLAERFGWKVGDRIPIQAPWRRKDGSNVWAFDLVGIYEGAKQGTDESIFAFRYDYWDEARQYGEGQVGWYWVRVADPDESAAVAAAIDAEFANSPAETKTETEKAFMQGFANQIGNVGKMLTAILSAVFFTILLVAGNTMALSVRERVQELGVLKAVGFSDATVLALVLAESLAMAVLGGGLGLAVAWWLVSLGDPTGGALPVFYMPGRQLAMGVGMVAALGLVAGLLPALQARRLRIADALRR